MMCAGHAVHLEAIRVTSPCGLGFAKGWAISLSAVVPFEPSISGAIPESLEASTSGPTSLLSTTTSTATLL